MSLKSIRESYSKLLNTFNSAGMKINESQKSDLDGFIMALESTMSEQRKSAILKTEAKVTAKLEKQYKELFESILSNIAKNNELNLKIQNCKTRIEESQNIATKVSDYLDMYVESVLPKKTVVDYDRMVKLERLHESLQDLLLVNDETVQAKKEELVESFKDKECLLEAKLAKAQVELNKQLNENKKMQIKLDKFKGVELLESKVKDLPSFEANKIKKILGESTASEINNRFDTVLAEVQNESQKIAEEVEKSIDEEIDNVLDNKKDEQKKSTQKPSTSAGTKLEEEFETTESIVMDEDGDVVLEESDIIDQNMMKWYCSQV